MRTSGCGGNTLQLYSHHLVAAVRDIVHGMVSIAGSLPKIEIAQLRHHLRTQRDAVWQHTSPMLTITSHCFRIHTPGLSTSNQT